MNMFVTPGTPHPPTRCAARISAAPTRCAARISAAPTSSPARGRGGGDGGRDESRPYPLPLPLGEGWGEGSVSDLLGGEGPGVRFAPVSRARRSRSRDHHPSTLPRAPFIPTALPLRGGGQGGGPGQWEGDA